MRPHVLLLTCASACTVAWDSPSDGSAAPQSPEAEDAPSAGGTPVAFDTGLNDEPTASGETNFWDRPLQDGASPFNTCADARNTDPVGPGTYQGTLAGFTASQLRPACPSFGTFRPSGTDAFLRVVVPPRELLMVDFEMGATDVVIALLQDCANPSTCLAGGDDNGSGANARETAAYPNETNSPVDLYLHLSRYSGTGGAPYTLELNTYPLPPE